MHKKKVLGLIIGWFLLSLSLVYIGHKNFIVQRDAIVEQQEAQLLTLATNVSKSLDRYFSEYADALWLMSQSEMIDKALFDKYLAFKEDEILELSLLTLSGEPVFVSLTDIPETKLEQKDVLKAINTKDTVLTKAEYLGDGQFIIKQIQPVLQNGDVTGLIVQTIDINKVYSRLMESIKPGNYGYVLVKSADGVLIMHPVKDQIGSNSLVERKEKFPSEDWSELEQLFEKQLREGEGVQVYHSKLWQDDLLEWSKKVTAFTTFKGDNNHWIISVQMDYSEIETPILNALINTIAIASVVFILLTALIATILIRDRKLRVLILEAKYHKALSDSWQALVSSEARLRHAQKLEMLGTLTSGIAHEFNNLLSPILGHAEIVLHQLPEDHESYDSISEIHQTAEDAREIIAQLLTYSRREEPNVPFSHFDLQDLVQECHKLIRPIMPFSTKLTILTTEPAAVYGNRKQIQQVLLNLITNAYQSITAEQGKVEGLGQGQIEIAIHSDASFTTIEITDNGSGMSEETLSKVFTPFFTSKSDKEGTGLGLYVVKNIIEAHHGAIDVSSEIGKGTRFIVKLPKS